MISCASAYGVKVSLKPSSTYVVLTKTIPEKTFTCTYQIPRDAIFVNVTWGKIVEGPNSHVSQMWTAMYNKDAKVKLSSSAQPNYEGLVKGSDAKDLNSILPSHSLTILKYPSFEEEPDIGPVPGSHLDTRLITRDSTLHLTCTVTYRLLWHKWRTLTFSETTPSKLVMVFPARNHPAYDPFLLPTILPITGTSEPGQNRTFRCNYVTPPGMKSGREHDLVYYMDWFVHIKAMDGTWKRKQVWTTRIYQGTPTLREPHFNKPASGYEDKVISAENVTYESIQYTHAITLISIRKDDSLFSSHAPTSYFECAPK